MSIADEIERLDAACLPPPWFSDYEKIGQGNAGIGEMDLATEAELVVLLRNNVPTIIAALREQEAWERIEAALPIGWTAEVGDWHAAPGKDDGTPWQAVAGDYLDPDRSARGDGATRLAALTALADALESR